MFVAVYCWLFAVVAVEDVLCVGFVCGSLLSACCSCSLLAVCRCCCLMLRVRLVSCCVLLF